MTSGSLTMSVIYRQKLTQVTNIAKLGAYNKHTCLKSLRLIYRLDAISTCVHSPIIIRKKHRRSGILRRRAPLSAMTLYSCDLSLWLTFFLIFVRHKEHLSSVNVEDQDETKRTGVVDSSFERPWCTDYGYEKCFRLLWKGFFSFLRKYKTWLEKITVVRYFR